MWTAHPMGWQNTVLVLPIQYVLKYINRQYEILNEYKLGSYC